MSIRDIAEETKMSKSKVHRPKKQIDIMAIAPGNIVGTPEKQGLQGKAQSVPCPPSLGSGKLGQQAKGCCDGAGCPYCQPERYGIRGLSA
jgi:hypothetical protein